MDDVIDIPPTFFVYLFQKSKMPLFKHFCKLFHSKKQHCQKTMTNNHMETQVSNPDIDNKRENTINNNNNNNTKDKEKKNSSIGEKIFFILKSSKAMKMEIMI